MTANPSIGTIHLTTSVALVLDKLEDYLGRTNHSALHPNISGFLLLRFEGEEIRFLC